MEYMKKKKKLPFNFLFLKIFSNMFNPNRILKFF